MCCYHIITFMVVCMYVCDCLLPHLYVYEWYFVLFLNSQILGQLLNQLPRSSEQQNQVTKIRF